MTLISTIMLLAALNGVPGDIMVAVCRAESGLNPRAINRNDGGEDSIGVCQIKLSTARHMGFKGKVSELYYPHINAFYASKYLKYQLNRYNNLTKALVAYNAGRAIKNLKYAAKVYTLAAAHPIAE